jgi:hypothetical protein
MDSRSEKEGTCSFVPKQLPFCPRPLSSELLTSCLERVAVANLLSSSQLLDSLLQHCPELNKVCPCLDYDLPVYWAKGLEPFVGLIHIGFGRWICAGSSRVNL